MASFNLDALLSPVSEALPCGPDLDEDIQSREVLALTKGRPATQIGDIVREAEPPDWRAVRSGCLELLAKGRDLRFASWLCVADTAVGGIDRLAPALELVQALVEQRWEHVQPALDPEDDNDPRRRVNALKVLGLPTDNPAGAPLQQVLMEVPLTRARRLGPFSLRDIRLAQGIGEGSPQATMAEIDAAFAETAEGDLSSIHSAISRSAELVAGIERQFNEKAGGGVLDLSGLRKTLAELAAALQRYVGGTAAPVADDADPEPGVSDAPTGRAPVASARLAGEVASRDDARMAIEKVMRYYDTNEPTSPVPLVLKVAKALIYQDFEGCWDRLDSSAVQTLRQILEKDEQLSERS